MNNTRRIPEQYRNNTRTIQEQYQYGNISCTQYMVVWQYGTHILIDHIEKHSSNENNIFINNAYEQEK